VAAREVFVLATTAPGGHVVAATALFGPIRYNFHNIIKMQDIASL
jgi:hypothetical protein